jgi:LmbE family N-acetylglucosaminyl deacetylase
VPFTLVAFHAHPDDEALLTAGTLARAVAEGHRVVLVVATAGEAGLVRGGGTGPALGSRRRAELERSAAALGCARVEVLGYADSGMHGEAGGSEAFCRVPVEEAAQRLAQVLLDEAADVLTVYDPVGGYGHPDHVQVGLVGIRAAELAGTPSVLEATVDRTALQRALRLVHRLPGIPADFAPARFDRAFTARRNLTHSVDVRPYAGADEGTRTLAVLLRLPQPLFRFVLGREWYVERGRLPAPRLLDDVFASVRG